MNWQDVNKYLYTYVDDLTEVITFLQVNSLPG